MEDKSNVSVKPGKYKGDILKMIGIAGQFSCARSQYYFGSNVIFRRNLRDLVDGGLVEENSVSSTKTNIKNTKEFKNLSLTRDGKKRLKELYPDVYEHYMKVANGKTARLSSREDSKKRMCNFVYKSMKKHIENMDLDENEKKKLLFNLDDFEGETRLSKLLSFANKNKLESFDYKKPESSESRLLRALKLGDVIGFLYNNRVSVLDSDKNIEFNESNKYKLKEKERIFFLSKDLKNAFYENVSFAKTKGVLFTEKETYVLYNVKSPDSMWEFSHEQKFINNLRVFQVKYFKDRKKIKPKAILFYKNYSIVERYLFDRMKKTQISILDEVYDSIHFIPLFLNEYISEEKKRSSLDILNYLKVDYSNEFFKIICSDFNGYYLDKKREFLEQNSKLEVGEVSELPFDLFSKDKTTNETEYHFSFLNMDILRLKKAFLYADVIEQKIFVYAFNVHKSLFNSLCVPENVQIKYVDISKIKIPNNTILAKYQKEK